MNTPTTTSPAEVVVTEPLPDLVPAEVFTGSGDDVRLLGGRCDDCGTAAFPRRQVCTGCGGTAVSDVALADQGLLYSFTTIHVSGTRSTPYTLGYVDLADGVRLLAQVDTDPGLLHPDQPVRLQVSGDRWTFEPTSDSVQES